MDDATTEPRFVLRRLQATDVRTLSTIISKIGIKEFAPALTSDEVMGTFRAIAEKEDADQNDMTFAGITASLEVVSIILANYGKCEQDLFAFMGSVAGLKTEEVGELPLDEFAELLISIVKRQDFKSFFSVARRLFQ